MVVMAKARADLQLVSLVLVKSGAGVALELGLYWVSACFDTA